MHRILITLFLALIGAAFLRADDEAAAFFDDSAVREIRLYFDDANWYNTLLRGHATAEDPYFPCRFRYGNTVLEKIGCRFKGNSSAQRNGIKKPFKLELTNRHPFAPGGGVIWLPNDCAAAFSGQEQAHLVYNNFITYNRGNCFPLGWNQSPRIAAIGDGYHLGRTGSHEFWGYNTGIGGLCHDHRGVYVRSPTR